MCTIYGLVDPFTAKVVYVGAAVNAYKRFLEHCSVVYTPSSCTNKKDLWLLDLHEKGYKPFFCILHECRIEKAVYYECMYFDKYNAIHPLLNGKHPAKHRYDRSANRVLSRA